MWKEPLWLIGAPSQAKHIKKAGPKTLAALPFITSPRQILRRTLEDEQLYSAGVLSRQVVIELGRPEAIKNAVRHELGFASIEASTVTSEIKHGGEGARRSRP